MKRRLASSALEVALSTAVVALALGVAMVFVAASGASATETLSTFFSGAFGGTDQIAATLSKMVPLVLVALGWIVVFAGGRFHVGFQGQILIGGLLAGAVVLHLDGLPAPLLLLVGAVAGMIGGVMYATVVAWLWARRGVNEVLSTLLLNLVAIQIVAWAVRGPLKEGGGILPQTDRFADGAMWPMFFGSPFLRWDIVLIPLAVGLVTFVLGFTRSGLRLRLVGGNPVAARYAGMAPIRVGAAAILASGLISGLAGSVLIQAGDTRAVADGFDAGYGFLGIAVALLARNSPIGCIPAALLFAALLQGGGVVEAQVGVPSSVVGVTQGLVICFVTAAAGLAYVLRTRSTSVAGASPSGVSPNVSDQAARAV